MISREEVLELAELARLKLTEAEVTALQKDISEILAYVGQVSAVAFSATPPKPFLRNVLREDRTPSEGAPVLGSRDALVAVFPKKEKAPQGGTFNVVRRILPNDEQA